MKVFKFVIRYFATVLLMMILASCTLLPSIKPVEQSAEIRQKCQNIFLSTPHRFVHAIEATLPQGTETVLGITVFDPVSKSIRSAIVTIEGLVLFEALYDKEIHIYRALPPFNAAHFAENMIEDVRLIFFPPEGQLSDLGNLEDGSIICRYTCSKKTIDVIAHPDKTWEVVSYRNRFERLRRLKAYSVQNGIPERLELTGFEYPRYSLSLKLISFEEISPEDFHSSQKNILEND